MAPQASRWRARAVDDALDIARTRGAERGGRGRTPRRAIRRPPPPPDEQLAADATRARRRSIVFVAVDDQGLTTRAASTTRVATLISELAQTGVHLSGTTAAPCSRATADGQLPITGIAAARHGNGARTPPSTSCPEVLKKCSAHAARAASGTSAWPRYTPLPARLDVPRVHRGRLLPPWPGMTECTRADCYDRVTNAGRRANVKLFNRRAAEISATASTRRLPLPRSRSCSAIRRRTALSATTTAATFTTSGASSPRRPCSTERRGVVNVLRASARTTLASSRAQRRGHRQ